MKGLLRIPWFLWFLGALGWWYLTENEFNEQVKDNLDQQISAKTAELATKKAEVAKGESYRASLRAKEKELADLYSQSEQTSKQLPKSQSIPEILKALADNSDRAGLDFISIKPQATRLTEFIVETPLEISLRGSYVQLMSFLDASVNLTRVIRVQSVKFSRPTTRGSIASLDAVASLVSYHVDEQLLRSSVGQAAAAASGTAATATNKGGAPKK
jgi:type IV pilus assembly protein PilO